MRRSGLVGVWPYRANPAETLDVAPGLPGLHDRPYPAPGGVIVMPEALKLLFADGRKRLARETADHLAPETTPGCQLDPMTGLMLDAHHVGTDLESPV